MQKLKKREILHDYKLVQQNYILAKTPPRNRQNRQKSQKSKNHKNAKLPYPLKFAEFNTLEKLHIQTQILKNHTKSETQNFKNEKTEKILTQKCPKPLKIQYLSQISQNPQNHKFKLAQSTPRIQI